MSSYSFPITIHSGTCIIHSGTCIKEHHGAKRIVHYRQSFLFSYKVFITENPLTVWTWFLYAG